MVHTYVPRLRPKVQVLPSRGGGREPSASLPGHTGTTSASDAVSARRPQNSATEVIDVSGQAVVVHGDGGRAPAACFLRRWRRLQPDGSHGQPQDRPGADR